MNRKSYLQALERQLRGLSKEDFQETIDYFQEYFDEAGPDNEEAVIQQLGSPKEAARDILTNLYDKEKAETSPRTGNLVWLVILSILAAPIGIPLAIALIALLVSLLLLLLAGLLILVSLCIVAISLGIASFFVALDLFSLAPASSLLFTGLSLVSIALGILGSRWTILAGQWSLLHSIDSVKKLLNKGDSYETA